jgi:hypothetical protein
MLRPVPEALQSIIYHICCLLKVVTEQSRVGLVGKLQAGASRHEVHAHEVHVHEAHAHEIHTHEVHTHEIHAHEMYSREMHAREIFGAATVGVVSAKGLPTTVIS